MTRASNERPTRRLVHLHHHGDVVVELYGDGRLGIRKVRRRRGGATDKVLHLGLLYLKVLQADADAKKAEQRKRRRRR